VIVIAHASSNLNRSQQIVSSSCCSISVDSLIDAMLKQHTLLCSYSSTNLTQSHPLVLPCFYHCDCVYTDDVKQQLWVPGPYAIAHHLMALWAERDDIFSEPLSTTESSSTSSNSATAATATSAVGKL
jgi:hypothetical protein